MPFLPATCSRSVALRNLESEGVSDSARDEWMAAGWVWHRWGMCRENGTGDRGSGLIQGILHSSPSHEIWLDVRARFSGRIFLAILGTPVIEALIGAGKLSFEIGVSGDGPAPLHLEGLRSNGQWCEFHIVENFSLATRVAAILPVQAGSFPDRILRFLRLQHQRPQWSTAHCLRTLFEAEAADSPLLVPVAPWWGNLESCDPASHAQVDHWQLSVWGWLAHETARVVKVEAWVHPWLPSTLEYGKPRPDVPRVFPKLSGAGLVGFEGQVVVPASLPAPWNLTVVAKLDDGTHRAVFARRIWGPACAEELHDELPIYSRRVFWHAVRNLIPTIGGWTSIWREKAGMRAARLHFEKNASTDLEARRGNFWHAPAHVNLQASSLSVVIVNDNLILGGAALFAFEYARYLKGTLKWHVHMVAIEDGPLRKLCEDAGLQVTIVDPRDAAHLDACLDWPSVDLIVVNTLVAQWAVPLASRWRKPSLLYLHEGARLRLICGRETTDEARTKSAEAIRSATCVVFVTRWTRSHHAQLERKNHFRLLRSWVDLTRVDQFIAQNDPGELRYRHGIPGRIFVFACLASICDRKGQRALIRAVQWLRQGADRPPGHRREFTVLLVGARPTPDTIRLAAEIETLGLKEVRLVAETPRAWEFLMLADAYVCPSFEEGFPRALMEAAAMRKWIVATSIPGNREMLTETEAWMVPPGDLPAIAHAMELVMKAADARDYRRPDAARWKMERWFDDTQSLPVHAALALEVAGKIIE